MVDTMNEKSSATTIITGGCLGLIAGFITFDLWICFVEFFSHLEKTAPEDIYPSLYFYGIYSESAAFYGLIIPLVFGVLGAIIYARQKTIPQNNRRDLILAVAGALICSSGSIYWCLSRIIFWNFSIGYG